MCGIIYFFFGGGEGGGCLMPLLYSIDFKYYFPVTRMGENTQFWLFIGMTAADYGYLPKIAV